MLGLALALAWLAWTGPGFARRRRALIALGEELSAGMRLKLSVTKTLEAFACDIRGSDAQKVERITVRVREGAKLSTAVGEAPRIFPHTVRDLIAAGEAVDNVEGAMREVSRWAWRDYREHGATGIHLWYPVVLGAFFAGVGGFWATFMAPRLMEIFSSKNQGLGHLMDPPPWVFLQAELKVTFGYLPLAAAVFFLGWSLAKRWTSFRDPLRAIQFYLPGIGRFERLYSLERIGRVLSMALASGARLPAALRAASFSGVNPVFRDALGRASREAEEGKRLDEALAPSGRFPARWLWKVGLAERSSEPGRAMAEVADGVEEEIARLRRRWLWILVVGVVFLVAAHVGVWEVTFFDSIRKVQEVVAR
jgi:general secretion pathway protein F